jgi:hypothetical protein
MKKNGRQIAVVVLVFAAMVGAISYLNWLTSAREFRGTLVYRPGLTGIPEDPPALAYLVTEDGAYELAVPLTRGQQVACRSEEHEREEGRCRGEVDRSANPGEEASGYSR